jgi:hypothetical protein
MLAAVATELFRVRMGYDHSISRRKSMTDQDFVSEKISDPDGIRCSRVQDERQSTQPGR